MDEKRLKFFMALQKRVEESEKISEKTKDKFYSLAENLIGEKTMEQAVPPINSDFAQEYKNRGYVKLNLGEFEIIIDNTKKSKKETAKEHKPKDVARFMALFNKRDGLKYLTHDYDENEKFDIDDFLKKSKKQFEDATSERTIPQVIFAIVNQFAFESEPNWGEKTDINKRYEYSDGFSTPKWLAWSKENQQHPKENQEFKKIINKFRSLIRIDPGENSLQMIVKELAAKELESNGMKVDYHRLDKADFYCHVPTLRRALKRIFAEIAKRGEKNKSVKIEYVGELDPSGDFFAVNLKILHIGSYPEKELVRINDDWNPEKGDMGAIWKILHGHCDWAIETLIEGKPYKANLLMETPVEKFVEIPEEDVKGFCHTITFYYEMTKNEA